MGSPINSTGPKCLQRSTCIKRWQISVCIRLFAEICLYTSLGGDSLLHNTPSFSISTDCPRRTRLQLLLRSTYRSPPDLNKGLLKSKLARTTRFHEATGLYLRLCRALDCPYLQIVYCIKSMFTFYTTLDLSSYIFRVLLYPSFLTVVAKYQKV